MKYLKEDAAFDEAFGAITAHDAGRNWLPMYEQIKSFIHTLLDDQKERIAKAVGGLKQPDTHGHYGPYDAKHIQSNMGYNAALTDVLAIINGTE